MSALDESISALEEEIVHYDHHHPRMADADLPYKLWETMRAQCPIAHSDRHGGYFVATRYSDIVEIAHHPEIFSSRGITIPPIGQGDTPLIPIDQDPPEHTRYRNILQPLLAPGPIAKLEPLVREVAIELIDGFIDAGKCDFGTDFAKPLTQVALAVLMGIPAEDREKFGAWVARCTETSGYDQEGALQAGMELMGYAAGLLEAKRQQPPPGEGLLAHLLHAERDGERLLSDGEVLAITFTLLNAGFETTYATIGCSLYYLAQHPEVVQRLIDEPDIMPKAIEEFIRYFSVVAVARTAMCDTEVAGQAIKKGEHVMVVFPSGSRDETEFPDASVFVPDRYPNRHLGFGIGIHRCLGMHLARMELRVVLEELLPRIPKFSISEGETVRWSVGQVRGVRSLPVTFSRS